MCVRECVCVSVRLCLNVFDLETSTTSRPRPDLGCGATQTHTHTHTHIKCIPKSMSLCSIAHTSLSLSLSLSFRLQMSLRQMSVVSKQVGYVYTHFVSSSPLFYPVVAFRIMPSFFKFRILGIVIGYRKLNTDSGLACGGPYRDTSS